MRHQALTKQTFHSGDGFLLRLDGENTKAGDVFITIQYSVLYGVYGCLHVSGKEVLTVKQIITFTIISLSLPDSVTLLLLLILWRAASNAVFSHTGEFRVGGGVHDSYTFQCGLVGSFTSPGIDTR